MQWVWVGLRPQRSPIRVEAQTMSFDGKKLKVNLAFINFINSGEPFGFLRFAFALRRNIIFSSLLLCIFIWNFAVPFYNALKSWGVFHLGQEKLVNCNQILDHQHSKAQFYMSLWNLVDVVVSRNTQYKEVTTKSLCFCTERCWHLN